jgi:hypothetical protein
MSIQQRNDLTGINTFARMFNLNRKTVQRMIDSGMLDGISITDGDTVRVFIDLGKITEDARGNDVSPSAHVLRIARQSRK